MMMCNEDERDESGNEGAVAWTRLSEMSFARDWDSEEDAVYDDRP
jgi:hypothetical protein